MTLLLTKKWQLLKRNGDRMKIKWLHKAINELDTELTYIAQDNPEAVRHIYTVIKEHVLILKDFPQAGRMGRVFHTRELIIEKYSYIIPYRIKNDCIEILRFFNSKRKPPC